MLKEEEEEEEEVVVEMGTSMGMEAETRDFDKKKSTDFTFGFLFFLLFSPIYIFRVANLLRHATPYYAIPYYAMMI